ncbi:MAG TPA: hypothetical protein VK619_06895 [Pyrinomonadaceae bacterium]|nr:hypothetical protein [Pyrinomonadaceae bacterium]
MSQNNPTGGSTSGQGSKGTTGGSTTGAGTGGSQGLTPSTSGGGQQGGQATGAATGLAAQAQEYGQKIADAASTAKDFVSERVSVVGDKIKDLQNADFGEMANQAKTYAKQNPGQALLISAAAGFVLGLLIRGSRR